MEPAGHARTEAFRGRHAGEWGGLPSEAERAWRRERRSDGAAGRWGDSRGCMTALPAAAARRRETSARVSRRPRRRSRRARDSDAQVSRPGGLEHPVYRLLCYCLAARLDNQAWFDSTRLK